MENNVIDFKNKVEKISKDYGIDINESPENIEYDHTGEEPNEKGLLEKKTNVMSDGSGALFPIGDDIDLSDVDLDIVTEEEKRIDTEFQGIIDSTKVTREDIIESLKETFNFATSEQLEVLYDIVKRIDNGEEFSIYNALPDNVKDYINTFSAGVQNHNAKRMFANEFFKNLTKEIRSFKAYDNMAKFKEKKTDEIIENDFKELYQDYFKDQKERFENSFTNRYEILNKEDSEEAKTKAQLALDIVEGYKESYTLNKFKENVFTHKGKYRFKRIDFEKPERVINSFNLKYANNPDFNNADISLIEPILLKFLNQYFPEEEYTVTDSTLFIFAFIKYTMNFSANNLADHTFMFYFINNIRVFNLVTSEYDINFIKNIITNIADIINILREVNNEKNS